MQTIVRRAYERRGMTPNVLVETGNVAFIKDMVERGEAVSFLVRSTIDDEIARGSVKVVPILDEDLELEVSIAYLEDGNLSPA